MEQTLNRRKLKLITLEELDAKMRKPQQLITKVET